MTRLASIEDAQAQGLEYEVCRHCGCQILEGECVWCDDPDYIGATTGEAPEEDE